MSPNICLVIPVYNHGQTIRAMAPELKQTGLTCYLVNDGSNNTTHQILDELDTGYAFIKVLHLWPNQGKGTASFAGFQAAYKDGFTHAIQIDADAQHNISQIETFVSTIHRNPDTLITGRAVYDDSVPPIRFYGRYLTHVLVWLECLSTSIKDSMCGFRVYPLEDSLKIHKTSRVGSRMEFDTEMAVRLYWSGLDVINIDTPVTYHPGGLSNYRMVRDNLRIIWMHLRMITGMLIQIPRLLVRHKRK